MSRPSWPSDRDDRHRGLGPRGPPEAYRDFLDRWSGDDAAHDARWVGPLAEQIRLLTEWAVLARPDPFLPLRRLPEGRPRRARLLLFVRRHRTVTDDARAEFEELRETIEVDHGLPDRR